MKRNILLTLGLMLGLGTLVSLAWVGVSHASDMRTGDRPTLSANETTDSSLYAAGNTVVVAGTVKGDLYCAGVNVEVTGTVEGDVICGGQNVRVSGKVNGDIRVAAQNVEITSEVMGSVSMFGQSLVLGPEAKVGRDLVLAGASAHLEGTVGRDVLGGSDALTLMGTVGRHVNAEVNALSVGSRAVIGGDLSYTSPATAQIEQGSSIKGQTHYTAMERNKSSTTKATMWIWGVVYGLLSMLVLGLAFIFAAPRAMDATATAVRTRPVVAFAAGCAVLIVTPLVALVLMVSLVGIPLAIVLMLSWIVALVASLTIAAYGVGWMAVVRMNWPPRARRATSLLVGLLILTVVGLIPFLGGLVVFVAMLVGLGALTVSLVSRMRSPRAVKKAKA